MKPSTVPDKLSGQYIGGYTNKTSGKGSFLCVNIDHVDAGNHEAYATIFSGDKIHTTTFNFNWTTDSLKTSVTISGVTEYIRQEDGVFKKSEPNMQQYKKADLDITWADGLQLSWTVDNGEIMQSDSLVQTSVHPSKLDSTRLTWKEFKKTVEDFEARRYIFRGQSVANKLRTSFHRTNRSNITRYHKNNIPELQHFLSSVDKGYSSLAELSDLFSILTLAQHHGYPTPILDWTASPYIAAYFAFLTVQRETTEQSDNVLTEHVRIYQFDLEEYQKDFPQSMDVNDIYLHTSFVITPPLNNPRAIPQQSISCISTIDDIESYMDYLGKNMNKQFLSAYDIHVSEAESALKDLELMGITHASLFPGLDGICAYLKRKHFGIKQG